MKADPQYAPEHLALEAVRRLGPEAAEWAAHHQPKDPDELALEAIRHFTTLARISGAVSGAAGLPGAVLDVGVLAWNQARMVLHIAAAYGVDPTAPERATDLLILQKVHHVAESARIALGVAAGRERASRIFTGSTNRPLFRVLVSLGVKLGQMAGVRAARKIFAKMIPGAGIILGTWVNSAATKDPARRARIHYRNG
ncbi:EcsC family protein [Actinoplanes sp. NPDC051861]|uniref:EcsC family protein n=1 Tax=Actinoplanes sp. NPDC051861 TaxID=3155170 RepID=UPI003417F59F